MHPESLQVAVEAARGRVLLRQDLLKPGGPSGQGSHTDADETAERLIRDRLLTARPE